MSRSTTCSRIGMLTAITAFVLAGCGDSGPRTYDLAGEVSFQGQPVPAGRIYFNPDPSKGNRGPQGYADIADGKFDTRQHGRATSGGPMIIRIEGFGGPAGNPESVGPPLCVYEVHESLPYEDSTHSFAVPATAAVAPPTGPLP